MNRIRRAYTLTVMSLYSRLHFPVDCWECGRMTRLWVIDHEFNDPNEGYTSYVCWRCKLKLIGRILKSQVAALIAAPTIAMYYWREVRKSLRK